MDERNNIMLSLGLLHFKTICSDKASKASYAHLTSRGTKQGKQSPAQSASNVTLNESSIDQDINS